MLSNRTHPARIVRALLIFTVVSTYGILVIPTPQVLADDDSSGADVRTDAERIAGAKTLIANDKARQQRLAQNAERLNARFDKMADRFTELDRRRAEMLRRSPSAPIPSAQEQEWKSARDELNQLIHRRKLVQDQLQTLSEKLQLEHDYLRRLSQPSLSSEPAAPIAKEPLAGTNVPPSPAAPTPPPILSSFSLAPTTPVAPGQAPAAGTAKAAGSPQPGSSLLDADERVVAARKDQQAKLAALQAARERLQFLDRSIDVFERDLNHSREILADAMKTAGESKPHRAEVAVSGPADAEETVRLAEAEEERAQARESVQEEAAVIAETQAMLKRLHASRASQSSAVTAAEAALSSAQTWMLLIESPLSPSYIVRWLTERGPKVVSVMIVTLIMLAGARLIERRILAGLLKSRGKGPGQSGRAETLRRVFHSSANFAILTLGILAALDQAGVNVTVLLGGAAVLGAAIAFGSQHLIRDFFSGFMILVENQYSVGHVVAINTKAGLVEDITLRMTVLRDEEGIVHFIPHSEATVVSNLTYGWARAVFDIAIDYRENVDRVMEVLMDLARELRNDPQYGMLMLDNPELQGVDRLGDSAVSIKFLIKTQPIQQWNVKRELLRRIKNRFDELGIAFAFPQRELHFSPEQSPMSHPATVTADS